MRTFAYLTLAVGAIACTATNNKADSGEAVSADADCDCEDATGDEVSSTEEHATNQVGEIRLEGGAELYLSSEVEGADYFVDMDGGPVLVGFGSYEVDWERPRYAIVMPGDGADFNHVEHFRQVSDCTAIVMQEEAYLLEADALCVSIGMDAPGD